MKKARILAAGASLTLALALCASAASFAKTRTYEGGFADLNESEWYASEVKNTYELGLMQGDTDGNFLPNGNVTVAEALTVASRAASISRGEEIPAADGEWYQSYVNYAVSKGIIKADAFKTEDFDRAATRAEVASFFAKALPEADYNKINNVEAIPDVTKSRSYYEDVMRLYNAGILMGNDSYGTFSPEKPIIRAEVAAIINRAALPENRVKKSLDKISWSDAYLLAYHTGYTSPHEGIASGWLLDNRGGTPRTSMSAIYGALFDIYEDSGTAYIREFNRIDTGLVEIETSCSISGYDGVSLELHNEADKPIFKLATVDGNWCVLNKDGKYDKVYDITEAEVKAAFKFHFYIDLDNEVIRVKINDKEDAVNAALLETGDECNLYNFRFATDEEHKPAITPGSFYAYTNYSFYNIQNFNIAAGETFEKKFVPAGGDKVVAEFRVMTPDYSPATYTLKNGDKDVAVFEAKDKCFWFNGVKVYEDYYNTMYYRIRMELDMNTNKLIAKVNARCDTEIPFLSEAYSIDSVVIDNSKSETALSMRWNKIFREIEHEDYCPEPIVPKGEDKYNVGINVCNMWLNGYNSQGGWSVITPYDEIQPAIGYYDESNPEAADWEIKYLVEHGVDFQAMCIFFGNRQKAESVECYHLFDGFMNAKYSHMTKFAMLWECGGGQVPANMDIFKNSYVPFMIENFFKDPRYMTINNRPVLILYSHDTLKNALGGADGFKEGMDYLRAELKKIGYGDMILLVCNTKPGADYGKMGIDGVYAYNWGTGGASSQINTSYMTASAEAADDCYTVPLVSVGFGSVAWKKIRYGLMAPKTFAYCLDWAKTEFVPKYAEKDWQKNLYMLSTWNEYGEGTYIMPTIGGNGFGYLDAAREAFTDEKADASLNAIPTASQSERITHLYPQYRRLLRRYYNDSDELYVDELEEFYTINAKNYGYCISMAAERDGTIMKGLTSTNDPNWFFNNYPDVHPELDSIVAMEVCIDAPKGARVEIFWTTSTHGGWAQAQSLNFTKQEEGVETVLINTSGATNFDGALRELRVDPCSEKAVDVALHYVKLFKYSDKILPRYITIDGKRSLLSFTPNFGGGEDSLIPFDPALGLDFQLRAFHLWDHDKKELTLYFTDHTYVFTVGKDTYTLDGKEVKLGYQLPEIDGLPYVPINRICDDNGFGYALNLKGEIDITTPLNQYYIDKENSRVPGQFEFNYAGDQEGWGNNGGLSQILANDGYLRLVSTDADPRLTHSPALGIEASKLNRMEIRCRYSNIGSANPSMMQMFFTTSASGGLSEDKSFRIRLNNVNTDEWETYTVKLDENATWTGTIRDLRFDPITCPGTLDVDYIRFYYVDEDFEIEEEAEDKE